MMMEDVAVGPARLLSQPPAVTLAAHQQRFGDLPTAGGRDLIDDVGRAGLRGRGGARFPAARKLQAVAARRRPVVVVNGCEGEPASQKDKVLMTQAPHLVLDGAALAAEAVGTREVILCVERNRPTVVAALESAIAERVATGLDRVRFGIRQAPNRYVAGEESALIHWLNGGEAKPTLVPPRPFERGVDRRPTLVNNVETLAQMALIARYGAEWFRSVGTPDDPGTFLVTVSGAVARPGVYEVVGGTSLVSVIDGAGGTMAQIQALLIGGYFGTWIPAPVAQHEALDAPSLDWAGASLGCGVIAALPYAACGLVESARVTSWLAGQNAGQCGPCVNGLGAIAAGMARLVDGRDRDDTYRGLEQLMELVSGRGACRHPDGALRFVSSSLGVFGEHALHHDLYGPCAAHPPILPTPATGGWR
jgi:NADH:ubiquinone oxidoreductase subunit F (NADH-binding)